MNQTIFQKTIEIKIEFYHTLEILHQIMIQNNVRIILNRYYLVKFHFEH